MSQVAEGFNFEPLNDINGSTAPRGQANVIDMRPQKRGILGIDIGSSAFWIALVAIAIVVYFYLKSR